MATYLVTRGCGFIGSHLAAALLATGHRVRIIDDLSSGRRALAPAGAEVRLGSITDPAAVATAIEGVDGCFHLAAIASVIRSIEDWSGAHRVNLGGAVRVFEAEQPAFRWSTRHRSVGHEPARPGEIRHSVGSTARAERLFGLTARVELVDGLRLTGGSAVIGSSSASTRR